MRRISFLSFVLVCGCATAQEDPGVRIRVDAAEQDAADASVADADETSAPSDAPGADDGTTVDTSPVDTGVDSGAMDTFVVTDTGEPDTFTPPVDTGTPPDDTGTPPVDTGPTCSASGSYGPTCANNAECAAIPGCGYVCCAFDPITKVIPLGCGRTSIGGTCLP